MVKPSFSADMDILHDYQERINISSQHWDF